MNLLELPPAVQKLAALGERWEKPDQWIDYPALGISREDIPALMEIVAHAEEFWYRSAPPESWTPVHAWRALGQLQAVESIPTLVGILPRIDENDVDIIQDELPHVFSLIGPHAIPGLVNFLEGAHNPLWSRIAAAESLKKIAERHAETRGVVIEALLGMLVSYPKNPYDLNSFLIVYLSQLKSAEGAPLVEKVLRSGKVDGDVSGDWEDYQVAVGLLKKRLTPRTPAIRSPSAFSDGLPAASLVGTIEASAGAEQPHNIAKKKHKKAHFQLKHAAQHAAKSGKEPAKHKQKEAKPKRKKGKKKK